MAGSNLITQIIINARDNASATLGSIQDNAGKLATALAAYFSFDTFKDLIESAAKFEKELDAVAAKGGYTADEMKKLTEFATTVGVEFGRSGTEAAQGLTILAGAGLSASEAMKALPSVLAVSASESVSMEVAASGLVATVGIMGLKFSDTARVADVLTKAANLSDASVVGLNESFKGVGAQAAAAGYSVEQTAAMLDVLAKYALKGEVAGTGLGAVLGAISDPASKTRVELSKLGVNSSDLGTVLDTLKGAGNGAASAIIAMGETAKPAILALLKDGSPALKKFEADLVSAGGASKETAATMTANFDGAKTKLLAVFENLKTTFGTPFLEPLTQGFDKLSGLLMGHIPQLVTAFEALATVMGIKATQAIITMTASLSGSAVAFGASQLAAIKAALSADVFAAASTRAATAVGLLGKAIPVVLAYDVGKGIGDWLSNFEGFRIGALNITQGVIGMGIAIKSVFNGDMFTSSGRAKYEAEIAFLAKSFDEQRAAASNAVLEEQKHNAAKIEGVKALEAEKNAALAKEVERMSTARREAEQFSAAKITLLKDESDAIDARYELANKAIAQNLSLAIEANHKTVQSTEARETEETRLIVDASDKVLGVLTAAAENKKALAKAVYDDAIAKSEGDTVKRAEYERDYATAKRDIDNEVLNTYRSTVDQMTAAAQAHRDKAIGYAREILDAEDRKASGILQLERIGMNEKELFASKKKEIEKGISDYKNAIAAGDYEEAKKISQRNEQLILSLASTEKTQSSEVRSLKEQYIKVIGQTEDATKGLQAAEEKQADALEQNAKTQVEKMAELKSELDKIDGAISKERLLKLNVDSNQLTEVKEKLDTLKTDTKSKHTVELNDEEVKTFKQTITADTFSKHTVYSDVKQTQDQLDSIKQAIETHHNVVSNTHAVAEEIKELTKDTQSKHEVTAEAKQAQDAIEELKKNTSSTHEITPENQRVLDAIAHNKKWTDSNHKIDVDNDDTRDAIAYNARDTYSQHTIYVRTIQQNANGGEIQHFANGGQAEYDFQRRAGGLGGYGGGDIVPAMLEPGEYIIKKESVRKYGSGFMAKLNAGQIENLPKYQFGGQVQYWNAPIGSPERLRGYLISAEATQERKQQDVNRAVSDYNEYIRNGSPAFAVSQTAKVNAVKAELEAAKKAVEKAKKEYEDAVKKQEESKKAADDKAKQEEATQKAAKEKEKANTASTDFFKKTTSSENKSSGTQSRATNDFFGKSSSTQVNTNTTSSSPSSSQIQARFQPSPKPSPATTPKTSALSVGYSLGGAIPKPAYAMPDPALAKAPRLVPLKEVIGSSSTSLSSQSPSQSSPQSSSQSSSRSSHQDTTQANADAELARARVQQEAAERQQQEAQRAAQERAAEEAQRAAERRLQDVQREAEKQAAAQERAAEEARREREKQAAAEKAAKELEKRQIASANRERLQLAGDDVGLENAAWAEEEEELAGNAAALAIARANHNERLKKIADDKAAKEKAAQERKDAEDKAAKERQAEEAKAAREKQEADAQAAREKQEADAKAEKEKRVAAAKEAQSQQDRMQDELDQINGNKMAIENRRFERQKEELKGNAGALAIASQIHAEKVKEINAEKKKESTTKNNATSVKAYEKKSSASVSASASQTSGGNTVTIRFESPTGRQASGSFAQADVTSVIEILKEAAERGLPPTF